MDDIEDLEHSVLIEARLEALQRENANLRKTLQIYNIEELVEMSDIEYICIKEIAKLRRISDNMGLSNDDIKSLDTLHKNIKILRTKEEKKKPPSEVLTEDELINLAKNNG